MEEQNQATVANAAKYCKHCGGVIAAEAVVCTLCGCQVEEMKQQASQMNTPPIIITNTNTNTNTNTANGGASKNKWAAVAL